MRHIALALVLFFLVSCTGQGHVEEILDPLTKPNRLPLSDLSALAMHVKSVLADRKAAGYHGLANAFVVKQIVEGREGIHIRVQHYVHDRRVIDGDAIVHFDRSHNYQGITQLQPVWVEMPQGEASNLKYGILQQYFNEVYQQEPAMFQGRHAVLVKGLHLKTKLPWAIVLSEHSGVPLADWPLIEHAYQIPVQAQGHGHYYSETVQLTYLNPWLCDLAQVSEPMARVKCEQASASYSQNKPLKCNAGDPLSYLLRPCEGDSAFDLYSFNYQLCHCHQPEVEEIVLSPMGGLYHTFDSVRGHSGFGNVDLSQTPSLIADGVDELLLGTGQFYHGPLTYSGSMSTGPFTILPSSELAQHLDVHSAAADFIFGFQKAWDYFAHTFARIGMSDQHQQVTLSLSDACNASFTTAKVQGGVGPNGFMFIPDAGPTLFAGFCYNGVEGQATNIRPVTTLDIIAHEFTHGVTRYSADLLSREESGGLNEATSDIFATLIEFEANLVNDTPDYTIAELADVPFTRYMYHPSLDGSSLDCAPVPENTPIHRAAGIGNHFFYLLAQGSEGSGGHPVSPVCRGNGLATGIGNTPAGEIWYQALTQCLLPTSTYCHARSCTLAVASPPHKHHVRQAWDAVNVTFQNCMRTLPAENWEVGRE